MEELMVCCRPRLVVCQFRELLLDVVQWICGRVSVDVDDANPMRRRPTVSSAKGLKHP